MLSYPWGCLWHEGCAPSFLSGPHLDKHCRYLILYHALVYIINFYPNHLYMISHPNFNFNLSILRKMILHVEPYLPYKFFFISTYILHERLKFIQFFFSYFDIIHIKTIVKRLPMMKGVRKCWCFAKCIPLSPLCSIIVGIFISSSTFVMDVFSVWFQHRS